ncbi:uncharacterized protein PG998_009049 [Apiospora kogelbergensis]|uniref:uncharacterized protein n=1 Tax=Apiospora kogelbergensis TaxID=1337665 RepID=UPI0031314B9D
MGPPSVSIDSLTKATSRTGVAVSKALFGLLATATYAPKEVYDVAKAVSDLSAILNGLTSLWGGPESGKRTRTKRKDKLQKRKLERQTASVVERIDMLHREIQALIDPRNAAARLLWAVRRSRWRKLLRQVESYKIGTSMIDEIADLAFDLKIDLKQLAK